MTKLKTPKEVADKKRAFLRRTAPADYAEKAWDDVAKTIRHRLYSDSASIGSKNRAELREFAQARMWEIAREIKSGKKARYAYKGKNKAAKDASDMLAKAGVGIAHVGHIIKLQEAVKPKRGSLAGKKMRFGVAQKLLNMHLKYMWCAGEMPEPPHCPFDRKIIFGVMPGKERNAWGRLDNVTWAWSKSDSAEDYLIWLAIAEQVRNSCYKSVSEWELFEFGKVMKWWT